MGLIDNVFIRNACLEAFDWVSNRFAGIIVLLIPTLVFSILLFITLLNCYRFS